MPFDPHIHPLLRDIFHRVTETPDPEMAGAAVVRNPGQVPGPHDGNVLALSTISAPPKPRRLIRDSYFVVMLDKHLREVLVDTLDADAPSVELAAAIEFAASVAARVHGNVASPDVVRVIRSETTFRTIDIRDLLPGEANAAAATS